MSSQPPHPPGRVNQQPKHGIPEVANSPFSYGKTSTNHTVSKFYDQTIVNSQVAPVAYVLPAEETTFTIPPEYVLKERRIRRTTIIGFVIVLLILSVLFLFTATSASPTVFVLALIPLTVGVGATFWIGKWDPEPLFMRMLVFLWGAVGAVGFAFLFGNLWQMVFPELSSTTILATVQAPIVEEATKSFIVLIIALFFRKYFSGPVDGIVYIMLAGLGFAFTENILYFIQSVFTSGTVGLGATFIMRGLLSPFAHPLFSLPMGILLGIAVEKQYKWGKTLGLYFLGYIPAMILHAIWNTSATLATDIGMYSLFYLTIQLPLFIGAIILVLKFRKEEANKTYRVLTGYGWLGWFTKTEVETLGTWEGRRYTKTWVKTKPEEAQILVHNLNRDAVKLANLKTMIEEGYLLQDDEIKILNRMWEDKQQMLKL